VKDFTRSKFSFDYRLCLAGLLCLAAAAIAPGPRADAGEAPADYLYDPTAEIATARAEIDANGYGWDAGITSMNLLPPELRPKLEPLPLPPGENGMLPADALVQRPSARDLPERWDWREHGGVTPVKNQGGCGSCWDFGATAAFESVIKIYTGIEYDLSEQQVLVCNERGFGCGGGWPYAAYELFMYPGAVLESCMPYTGHDNLPCTQYGCDFVDILDGFQDIPSDITTLKEKIYDHPVAVAFTVFNDFFSYSGGCYESSEYGPVNHIVLLVGWDDTLCDGEGAWIAKNSWGPGWGEAGYFYAKYGTCNIGSYAQEIFYSGVGQVHISHAPLRDTDNTTEPYDVQCDVISRDYAINDASVKLHYDVGSGWVDVLMTPQRPGETQTYRVQIPPQPLGTTIEYWLSAADVTGYEDVDPTGAPTNVHTFRILRTFFRDDVETVTGWTCGVPDDDAIDGLWERGIPEATYGIENRQGNPGEDHTPDPGEFCYCTGPEAGYNFWDNDVDGGKTTLLSPVVDLGAIATATLSYYRWYTNNAGQWVGEDYWQVDVTNDGENWVSLEYTNTGMPAWVEQVFELDQYVDLTSHVQLRFVASDYLHASNIEGAVDDVEIVSIESGAQGAGEQPRIRRIQLRPGPSPFTDAATIRLDLPAAVDGALRVLAVDGRVVTTLADGRLAGGAHRLIWDGRDAQGQPVPAGVYLLRLSSTGGGAEGRLLHLR
jgi:hypothetical protein